MFVFRGCVTMFLSTSYIYTYIDSTTVWCLYWSFDFQTEMEISQSSRGKMEDGEEVVYFYGLVRESAVRLEGGRVGQTCTWRRIGLLFSKTEQPRVGSPSSS